MTKSEILLRLLKLGVNQVELSDRIVSMSLPNPKARFFHTWDNHIMPMYDILEKTRRIDDPVLFLATFFHDVYYDPLIPDASNVFHSMGIFRQLFVGDENLKEQVLCCIAATADHQPYKDPKAIEFCELDLWALHHEENAAKILHDEYLVFKEYQFVEFSLFKEMSLEFLIHFNSRQIRLDLLECYQTKIRPGRKLAESPIFCGTQTRRHNREI